MRYLRQLYDQPRPIGFKLMYPNVLDYPEVWAFIAWHRLPVLHLVRRNHLDVYISSEVRFATRTVHGLVGEPEAAGVQIEPDPADLLRALRRSRRNIQIARRLLGLSRVPHLEIHYEDLLQWQRTRPYGGLRFPSPQAGHPVVRFETPQAGQRDPTPS